LTEKKKFKPLTKEQLASQPINPCKCSICEKREWNSGEMEKKPVGVTRSGKMRGRGEGRVLGETVKEGVDAEGADVEGGADANAGSDEDFSEENSD
jgi:hypothetical protein